MKPILMTDLDNTMIYSYKRDIGVDKIAIEPYEGKIVSYMTRFSYEVLKKLRRDMLFVPVTTRSVSQYRRISFDSGWTPEYALVSNGGTLLAGGAEDERWKRESLALIEPCLKQLEKAEAVLARDPYRTLDVRRVDQLFVFTKSEEPELTLQRLGSELDLTAVELLQNGVKIYVLPKALNKGSAVGRFLSRIAEGREDGPVICAGDSEFDLPLLDKGDVVFCPRDLAVPVDRGEIHQIEKGQILSDEVFRYLVNKIEL